jgi:hypothetical protein
MPSKDAGNNIENLNTEGQGKRQKNEVAVQDIVIESCPIEYNKLVATLSYKMHLAPDTIKYSFLSVLFNIGFISNDKYNIVYLKGTEPQNQEKQSESKCKSCGKPVSNNTTFCSKNCVEQYKAKEETKS